MPLLSPACAPIHREGSNGEAVVLVHGFTGHPGHFTFMAAALNEAGFTAVAPRLRGHGTTPDDLASATAADWMEDVVQAAAEVAGHRRVHLVGLSMGGLLSILAARPTAASSITTINTPVVVRQAQIYAAPLARHVIRRAPLDTSAEALDEEARSYWAPYEWVAVSAVAELQRLMLRAPREARRLRRPALVIQSLADEAVHPSSAIVLGRALGPTARVEWMESSIHNALLCSTRTRLHEPVLDHLRAQGAGSER